MVERLTTCSVSLLSNYIQNKEVLQARIFLVEVWYGRAAYKRRTASFKQNQASLFRWYKTGLKKCEEQAGAELGLGEGFKPERLCTGLELNA